MSNDAAVDSDRLPVDSVTSGTGEEGNGLSDVGRGAQAFERKSCTCWLTFLLSIWTLFFLTEYEESDTYQASYSFCNCHRPHNAR